MKLLDVGIQAGGPVTAEEFASGSGADVLLVGEYLNQTLEQDSAKQLTVLVRAMRMLVAMGIFEEVGHETYLAKPAAKVRVTGSSFREAVIHMCVPATTVMAKMPKSTRVYNCMLQRFSAHPSYTPSRILQRKGVSHSRECK
jgi:hypothetical protein